MASSDTDTKCVAPGTCTPPQSHSFSALSPGVVPRVQWVDNGGYCGAVSVQTNALSHGMWVSQDIVRKAAPSGGGHGDSKNGYEILNTNIEPALRRLRIQYEAFDTAGTPQPHGNHYLGFLKRHLAAQHPVVWFVICKGDSHDAYGLGPFDHIESVFGIYSNHPLSDPTVYEDDVLVHSSGYAPDGASNLGYFRRFDSLVDDVTMAGNCSVAQAGWKKNEMYPCVETNTDFGYAITGIDVGGTVDLPRVHLTLDRNDEPDIKQLLVKPAQLKGTVNVIGLVPLADYALFRFDLKTVADFDSLPNNVAEFHSRAAIVTYFTASADGSYQFLDPAGILSSGATVYKVANFTQLQTATQ